MSPPLPFRGQPDAGQAFQDCHSAAHWVRLPFRVVLLHDEEEAGLLTCTTGESADTPGQACCAIFFRSVST